MSLEKLLDEGLITALQATPASRTPKLSHRTPDRLPPRSTQQKLLAEGLLVEEQLSPSPTGSSSKLYQRLSTTSTLINDGMSKPVSSSGKWYHSRRLSLSSKPKSQESSRTPSPELLRQQAQSPQEMFESQLGKHFDMKRLGGLQTIRSAPKRGL